MRILDDPLAHKFAPTIGVDGGQGRRFGHGDRLRHAIDRRCGRKDELGNLVLDGQSDEVGGVVGIVRVILERIGHGFRDHDRPGKVQDTVEFFPAHQFGKFVRFGQVAHFQPGRREHGIGSPGGQVVIDDNFVSLSAECQGCVGADVSGTAGDENFGHGMLLVWLIDPKYGGCASGLYPLPCLERHTRFRHCCQARTAPKTALVLAISREF